MRIWKEPMMFFAPADTSSGGGPRFGGDVTPRAAFDALRQDPGAQMVDVRSQAEWSFVGIPDLGSIGKKLALIEWKRFPGMNANPDFLPSLQQWLQSLPTPPSKLFFLCRSGARSRDAALNAMGGLAGMSIELINVAEGFEGDPDAESHRGRVNGWKAAGLPWRQS